MRLIPIVGAVLGLGLIGCADEKPLSSGESQSDESAAKLTVSSAPAAGTAEGRASTPPEEVTPTTFSVRIENNSTPFPYSGSGVFNTPVGAAGPGPLLPGNSYEFSFSAPAGSYLSFATMYVQSNDLFFAPAEGGLALWDADGMPISGDITSQIQLWDAGTEINQEPGVGADQAPRQSGANTGADEGGPVQLVDDGFTYGAVADLISVTVSSETTDGVTSFTVNVANNADSTTPLAPGVWVVHGSSMPLFTDGLVDRGEGLEALAEDGNPAGLADILAARSGVLTILAPGVWTVHRQLNPLFRSGAPDRGEGLEGLAEDGNPANLAGALADKPQIASSGVFNTPAGAADPGPLGPGGAYEFTFEATPGYRLSFATMFVQSNDLFYAPSGLGIFLFSGGEAISGDITDRVMLWDAGTEMNQAPGLGNYQAPRQSGANTGMDEGGNVRRVDDGYSYPSASNGLSITITPL